MGRWENLKLTVTNLQTSYNKSVHKLLTSCVRTACSKLSEQFYQKLLIDVATGLKGCFHKIDKIMMEQYYYNLVISLMIPAKLLYVTSCQ